MVSQDYVQKMETMIAVLLHSAHHVRRICFGNELSIMICQDMFAVEVICLAVVVVEKVDVPNFVLVFCCFANSVASTRFMLQDEFNIQTTQCDNCIIGFMLCLNQIACIFSIVAMIVGSEDISEASHILNLLSDLVYCSVCACMQTQHKVEMDKRDGKFGPQPMAVPPVQAMSRIDQPYPPAVGYTPAQPQQSYGYPPAPPQGYPVAGYPPPPGSAPPQGYPPAGYPQ